MTRLILSSGAAQEGAPGWRYLLGALHLHVDLGSFPAALDFVATVGRLALPHDHQPEIDIRGSRVHLALTSRADGGVREVDLLLANEISALVVYLGHVPDHGRLGDVEITVDTTDAAAIAPFWRAVLGLVPDSRTSLHDPDRFLPGFSFRDPGDTRGQPGRIRLEVTLPHDEAPGRVAAALAAGGRLVSDEAPAAWVLADVEGNHVRLRTWRDAP